MVERLPTWVELLAASGIATGLWIAVTSFCAQIVHRGRRALQGPTELLGLARSFRRVVIGLALAGVGAGMLADLSWLIALSLIIGGQEVLESSIVAAALRDEEKRRMAEAEAAAGGLYQINPARR